MQFSRFLFILIFLIMSGAFASDLKNIIATKEYISCKTNNFHYTHLQGQSFIGGMVAVNLNQDGINTNNICK
ncbi:MAG: hypothetical protein H7336_08615 [Bacteriovorax sp.]|nr:hypothetical protein [Bacteriovorax sp.]